MVGFENRTAAERFLSEKIKRFQLALAPAASGFRESRRPYRG
jgi:hypothetical protein